uniref:Uncharacterized protein n=1 Tax=Panagrolaimus sp. ES5 TaxID=591445 RepID=A0AC34GXR9_9BILA
MSSTVKREKSQDSVVFLSGSDDEERFLKIHYQESPEFFEVPVEDDGRIAFKDVTYMDSKIFGLIIQRNDGYRRLIKPKQGSFKEPKQKWHMFKVYAALEKQAEVVSVSTCHTPNEHLYSTFTPSFDLNKKIKTETSPVFAEVSRNSVESDDYPSTSSSLSNRVVRIDKSKIKAESPTLLAILQNPDSYQRNTYSNFSSIDYDNSTLPVASFNEPLSAYDESSNCIIAMDEPTESEILYTFKVSSIEELESVLTRGNSVYKTTCSAVLYRFKRTLVTYPNKEIVRLFDCAKTSEILLKNLDLSEKDYCGLCDEALTLKHLLSRFHARKYRKKLNADPPEIAKLLQPKYYKKLIDPTVLAGLKMTEFKEMEESPEFAIEDSSQKGVLVKLKYTLINRILQGNLKLNNKKYFSVPKFLFLQKNCTEKELSKVFTIKKSDCDGCKRFPSCIHHFILHIFTQKHIQYYLNQEELDNICKAMSYIKRTSTGFCFLPFKESRKRKRSSNGVKNGNKRARKE